MKKVVKLVETTRRKLSDAEEQDRARLEQIWLEKKGPLNLTQLKLANQFGFSNSAAISQYITGKIPLNIKVVAKFAIAFGVPIDQISPRFAKLLPELGAGTPTFPVNDIEHMVFERARNNVMAPVICEGDLLAIDTRTGIDGEGITLPTGRVVAIFRKEG
jgi:transcriptional regulator with XRE-family HTH domain